MDLIKEGKEELERTREGEEVSEGMKDKDKDTI